MSCELCNLKKGPFKTEKIYSDFMGQVNRLVKENILTKLDEIDPHSPFIELEYKCTNCSQVWVLKVPDQAFRGGWYENGK